MMRKVILHILFKRECSAVHVLFGIACALELVHAHYLGASTIAGIGLAVAITGDLLMEKWG